MCEPNKPHLSRVFTFFSIYPLTFFTLRFSELVTLITACQLTTRTFVIQIGFLRTLYLCFCLLLSLSFLDEFLPVSERITHLQNIEWGIICIRNRG